MSKVHGGLPQMEMDEPFYVRRRPPPFSFWKFLYNTDNGTVMGRSGASWCKSIISCAAFGHHDVVVRGALPISLETATPDIYLTRTHNWDRGLIQHCENSIGNSQYRIFPFSVGTPHKVHTRGNSYCYRSDSQCLQKEVHLHMQKCVYVGIILSRKS